MRDRRTWGMWGVALGVAALSGGCIDAVREGAVAAVETTTEEFVSMVLQTVADRIAPGDADDE